MSNENRKPWREEVNGEPLLRVWAVEVHNVKGGGPCGAVRQPSEVQTARFANRSAWGANLVFCGQAETTFQLTFDQPGGVILPREARIVTKR